MTERDYEVRDGDRVLKFTGTLLAESTSRYRNQPRWIEFRLFRTHAGSYILSRIGNSIVFHRQSCSLVSQYRLKPGDIESGAAPCDQCLPARNSEEPYPERTRYWAQVMEQPAAVLEALYKYDDEGTKYLTLVAQRLLHAASERDEAIADVYNVEHVA